MVFNSLKSQHFHFHGSCLTVWSSEFTTSQQCYKNLLSPPLPSSQQSERQDSILQRCKQTRDAPSAKKMYYLLCTNGLDTQPSVGNHVVPMFAQQGCLHEAARAFQKIGQPHQNVYSWTSLICACVQFEQTQHIFLMYEKMRECGVHPCSHTFVALLKTCVMLKDVKRGKSFHIESAREGFQSDVFVNTTLIHMYFNFSSPSEARLVFDSMPIHDVVSWNALMTGYVEHGHNEDALFCFDQIKSTGDCSPNVVTYVCALKSCIGLKAIIKGQEIHIEIVQKSLEGNLLIGNTLIDMYSKFGSLLEAWVVFSALLIRDVVSWNALIGGFVVENGFCEDVFESFNWMHLEGILPDALTLVCVLRACSNLCNAQEGCKFHMQLLETELQKDTFVGNTVVDMYAKCGLVSDAQKAFNQLPSHDVVSWNALLSGYAEHGPFQEALKCFDQMELCGVAHDATTFVSTLKACANLGNIDKGRAVHQKIQQKGFEKNLYVGSTLVDMYAKCASLIEAENSFKKLLFRDVMSWNAMVAGYAEQGICQSVIIQCMDEMLTDGINPNGVTYACVLKSCANQKDISKGRDLHKEVSRKGLESDPFVGSALVDMYTGSGFLTEARNVFEKLPDRDVASWNALIAGCVECGFDQEALVLYMKMKVAGLSPDDVTFVTTLRACANVGFLDKGHRIHADITCKGLKHGLYVGNTLVDMYAKCGALSEAWVTFSNLPNPDVISWNTIIKGYGMNHDGKRAMQIFKDMRKQGVKPDAITFTCLLTACSRASLVSNGRDLFTMMVEEYGMRPSIDHYNCMVDLLARSGCLHEAEKFFETIPCPPSVALWTALISACKTFIKAELGSRCFDEILLKDPNCATSYSIMANICASGDAFHTVTANASIR